MTEGRLPHAFSPRTLAQRWECSERHIYNMIARGELPAFRIGKLLRIRSNDVLAVETQGEETDHIDSAAVENDGSQLPKRRPAAPRLDILQRHRNNALRQSGRDR